MVGWTTFFFPLGFLDISDGICSCCFGSKVEKKSSWWKGVVYLDPPSFYKDSGEIYGLTKE